MRFYPSAKLNPAKFCTNKVFMFLLQITHHVPFMRTFTLNLDYNMMKEAIGQWVPTKFEQYTHSNALG